MGLLLTLQKLMQLALVDVLLILSSIAAVCWIVPQKNGRGRLVLPCRIEITVTPP
jgi:hypothetical protein